MRARPNSASAATDTARTVSWADSTAPDNRLSAMPSPEKAATKPSTMHSGRRRPPRSTALPSRIGSSGSTQGEATVSMPAARARGVSIRVVMARRSVCVSMTALDARRVSVLCPESGFLPGFCIVSGPAYTTTHLAARAAL
ncbi:Uncharacterised protein [Achromobacter sp. 2789STDY5608621]|nr:Uncharacterised protein [Achromobacter sp. 2789STDY5608621]